MAKHKWYKHKKPSFRISLPDGMEINNHNLGIFAPRQGLEERTVDRIMVPCESNMLAVNMLTSGEATPMIRIHCPRGACQAIELPNVEVRRGDALECNGQRLSFSDEIRYINKIMVHNIGHAMSVEIQGWVGEERYESRVSGRYSA